MYNVILYYYIILRLNFEDCMAISDLLILKRHNQLHFSRAAQVLNLNFLCLFVVHLKIYGTERQTFLQTDRRTERQTDGQTDLACLLYEVGATVTTLCL